MRFSIPKDGSWGLDEVDPFFQLLVFLVHVFDEYGEVRPMNSLFIGADLGL
jgi:hypothetical protein